MRKNLSVSVFLFTICFLFHSSYANNITRVQQPDLSLDIPSPETTQLFDAVKDHKVDLVKSLLDKGANVNAIDQYGMTPLIVASGVSFSNRGDEGGRSLEIVNLLLAKGADVNYLSAKDRYTALKAAVNRGHVEIFKLLLSKGASIQTNGENAVDGILNRAIVSGNVEMIKIILQSEQVQNLDPKQSKQSMHTALYSGNQKMVKLLREYGFAIDPDSLKVFASDGNAKVIIILLNNGVDINQQDDQGKTPLMAAAKAKEIEAVQLLLQKGANVHLKDKAGDTVITQVEREMMRLAPEFNTQGKSLVDKIEGKLERWVQDKWGGRPLSEIELKDDQEKKEKIQTVTNILSLLKNADNLAKEGASMTSYIPARKLQAAENGDASQQFEIGRSYYYGLQDVSQNYAEAYYWFSVCGYTTQNAGMNNEEDFYKKVQKMQREVLFGKLEQKNVEAKAMMGLLVDPQLKKMCHVYITTLNNKLTEVERKAMEPRIEAWKKKHPLPDTKELSSREEKKMFLTERLQMEVSARDYYDMEGIEKLIDEGADVNAGQGVILKDALKTGKADVAQILMKEGANADGSVVTTSSAKEPSTSNSPLKQAINHSSNALTQKAIDIFAKGTSEQKRAMIEEVKSNSGSYDPMALMAVSASLFHKFEDDDALFWYLAAHLRADTDYRICQRKENSYSSFKLGISPVAEYYTRLESEKLAALVPKVLEWDRQTPINYNMQWGASESSCLASDNYNEVKESVRKQFSNRYSNLKRNSTLSRMPENKDNLVPLAEAGDKVAQYQLGQCYMEPSSCELNEYLQRVLDHQAQQDLDQEGASSKTFSGPDLDAEYASKAIYWLQKSADQKYIPAYMSLIYAYDKPRNKFIERDAFKSCFYVLELVKMGDTNVYNMMSRLSWNPDANKPAEQYAWSLVAAAHNNKLPTPVMPSNMSDEDFAKAKNRAQVIEGLLASSKPICYAEKASQ